MRRRPLLALAAVVCTVVAFGESAAAHKMIAASRVRGDGTVLLQAFFPDGRPAQHVAVEVRRLDGSLFLASETDEAGKLVVRPDAKPGRWVAVFVGSMGHRTETEFDVGVPEEPAGVAAVPAPKDQDLQDLARPEPFPLAEVLAGIGCVTGLCALLMCMKLQRQIQKLSER